MVFKSNISRSFGDLFIVGGGYFWRHEEKFNENFVMSGNLKKLQNW